jgi:uncharacterized membrane protein YphA (DoxX/SURF4 family)
MIKQIVHWAAYSYFLYLFAYASLFKVFQEEKMINGMQAFGFGETWTLVIGAGELLGVIALIIGIWHHQTKNAAVIYLLPYAIGALMVHMAYHDYSDYFDALFGSIAAVVILATDKYFQIKL